MPDMFVPEERWSPRAWGPNHRNTVAIHRKHGLEEADYGFWGFSPASKPRGGYREYGVDAIGLNQDGYFSDVEKTNFDKGFGSFRPGNEPEADVRRRGGHTARPVPGHAPRAAAGVRQPGQAHPRSRRVRRGRILRRHRGEVGHRGQALPVAGPGDGDGFDRQRLRPQGSVATSPSATSSAGSSRCWRWSASRCSRHSLLATGGTGLPLGWRDDHRRRSDALRGSHLRGGPPRARSDPPTDPGGPAGRGQAVEPGAGRGGPGRGRLDRRGARRLDR